MTRFDRLEFGGPEPLQPGSEAAGADADNAVALRDERYWLEKAMEERRGGFHENALRYYSRALELNKSLVDGWLGQVQMLIALAEFREAELWARKALELFKNHGDLLAGRAHALARLDKIAEALPLSDASFQREGQSAYRWVARAEIMLADGQNVEAHCFDKAVQLDKDWLLLMEIAVIYRYRRKSSKALVRIRQAVEKAPDAVQCWFIQGLCEQDLGMGTSAEKSFKRCLEIMPGHVDARRELNEITRKQGTLSGKIKRLFGRG